MSDEKYKKIFAKNLKMYMDINNKNQTDLMKDLGFSSSTVSNWCTGLKLPRMDKVQILADYFHINKSDLIEEKSINTTSDIHPETKKIAEIIQGNKDLSLLFEEAKNSSPEDLQTIHTMLLALNRKGRPHYETQSYLIHPNDTSESFVIDVNTEIPSDLSTIRVNEDKKKGAG